MVQKCDFCGDQWATLYCRSDSARLCMYCDQSVHSTNTLSQRHIRVPLCNLCNSQPATVMCVDGEISLCESCVWLSRSGSTSVLPELQTRKLLNPYYSSTMSRSLLLDLSSKVDVDFSTKSVQKCIDIDKDTNAFSTDFQDVDDISNLMVSSSAPALKPTKLDGDQQNASVDSSKAKLPCSETEDLRITDIVDFCESEDEFDLDVKKYEELFSPPDDTEKPLENGGIDGFINADANSVRFNCPDSSTSAAPSLEQQVPPNPAAYKDILSANQLVPGQEFSGDLSMCFFSNQGPASGVIGESASIVSDFTGENTCVELQDCGMASILPMGDPSWYPPGPENISCPRASRSDAVMRYREKKKSRNFDKTIRYPSRKARADIRRRVKGRFVRAGGANGYGPEHER